MADIASIRAKIAALRAKTVGNGCTEAEAMAAAEKAADLLAEYGLASADLDAPEHDTAHQDLAGRRGPLDALWGAVAAYCDCTCWLSRDEGVRRAVYFGAPGAVEIAAYVHEIMARAYEAGLAGYKASPEYQRRRKAATRAAARKAWGEAYAEVMAQRLMLGLWRRSAERSVEAFKASLSDRDERLKRSAETRFGCRLDTARGIKPAKGGRRLDGARADAAGHARSVQIEAGVTGAAPVRGLLS